MTKPEPKTHAPKPHDEPKHKPEPKPKPEPIHENLPVVEPPAPQPPYTWENPAPVKGW